MATMAFAAAVMGKASGLNKPKCQGCVASLSALLDQTSTSWISASTAMGASNQ